MSFSWMLHFHLRASRRKKNTCIRPCFDTTLRGRVSLLIIGPFWGWGLRKLQCSGQSFISSQKHKAISRYDTWVQKVLAIPGVSVKTMKVGMKKALDCSHLDQAPLGPEIPDFMIVWRATNLQLLGGTSIGWRDESHHPTFVWGDMPWAWSL